MTNEKKYKNSCPSCFTILQRRKRDVDKLCNSCNMRTIAIDVAARKRANPKRTPQKEISKRYSQNQLLKNPFIFRITRTYSQAKIRAKQYGVPFNITRQDLIDIFPKDNLCPVLKIPFIWGTQTSKELSPSLDRVIPAFGYVRGNINFISYKANRIKNDSNIEILKNLIKYME
jgi:predicted RNA-binding Zn-ribbon protein involved in translation (DUF1610 family)